MTGSQNAMETRTILRVIVNENDIRKITLHSKPQTLETLMEHLEEKLGLPYKFSLQYEDADFNNALINLTDIADLPERPTLKVISLVPSPTASTADTDIVSLSSEEGSSHVRQAQWPETFEVPNFPVDIEFRLRQGNLLYMRDQTYMQVPRDMKHEILEKLAECMYSFKAYPSDDDFNDVASSLVKKHPCLTEPGSSTGWNGWKNSLKFKMGNYRTKLRRAGCTDVLINVGKRGGQDPLRSVKRPKHFEINFLPNYPAGEDECSMESKRLQLVEEMKKCHPSSTLISQNMDSTFFLRRKEIVEIESPVKETLQRWPSLFTERQINAEFVRITSKNLKQDFFTALDQHTARFLKIFETKKGAVGKRLSEFLDQIKLKGTDITANRTAVLRGLPLLLGEETSDFFKATLDCDCDIPQISIGILTVITEGSQDSSQALHLENSHTAIILEGAIVMDNIENLPDAMWLLFGLIYALNLEYPPQLKNTFDFIQRVFLSLGHKSLKPKLQSLKNMLLIKYEKQHLSLNQMATLVPTKPSALSEPPQSSLVTALSSTPSLPLSYQISTAILVIAFVFGFPGNLFVVWSVLCRVRRRSVTCLLILNLAVADALVLLSAPLFLRYLIGRKGWEFGVALCKTVHYLCCVNMYASIYLICVMSMDRWLAVTKPFLSQRLKTKKRLLSVMLGIWVMAFLMALPMPFYRSVLPASRNVSIYLCKPYHWESNAHETFQYLTETILGFLLPFSFILFCYISVICRLRSAMFQRKERGNTLILLIIAAFTVFWLPYHLINILQVIGLMQGSSSSILTVAIAARPSVTAFTFISSSVNPVLYVFAGSSHIRQAGLGFMAKLFEGTNSESASTRSSRGSNTESSVFAKLSIKVSRKGDRARAKTLGGEDETIADMHTRNEMKALNTLN